MWYQTIDIWFLFGIWTLWFGIYLNFGACGLQFVICSVRPLNNPGLSSLIGASLDSLPLLQNLA